MVLWQENVHIHSQILILLFLTEITKNPFGCKPLAQGQCD
jgi:hypothetical protein